MQPNSEQSKIMKQKYFYHEHLADYAELKAKGLMSRGELYGNPNDFSEFSSKSFLIQTLPRLDLKPDVQVLELGCGTGPVACFNVVCVSFFSLPTILSFSAKLCNHFPPTRAIYNAS